MSKPIGPSTVRNTWHRKRWRAGPCGPWRYSCRCYRYILARSGSGYVLWDRWEDRSANCNVWFPSRRAFVLWMRGQWLPGQPIKPVKDYPKRAGIEPYSMRDELTFWQYKSYARLHGVKIRKPKHRTLPRSK